MKSVKDNFHNFIKQSDDKVKIHHVKPLKKRTFSMQDLSQIHPQRIKNSLQYNPTIHQ